MTVSDIQMWLSIGALAVSLGTAAWSLLTAGHRKNEKDIRAMMASVSAHDKKLDRLERTVADLPGNAAWHRLELMLADMRGDMKAMTATVSQMQNLFDHINEVLIENSKGKS